jgi:hypothetical protein
MRTDSGGAGKNANDWAVRELIAAIEVGTGPGCWKTGRKVGGKIPLKRSMGLLEILKAFVAFSGEVVVNAGDDEANEDCS